MCYFHVDKDCKKVYDKFKNKSHSEEIKHDISVIQLSKSREEFDQSVPLTENRKGGGSKKNKGRWSHQ